MKAIRIHKHGGPEVLQIDEIPVPQLQKDEVLIKVKAASLNHLDLWVRRGIPGLPLPLILGSDGAGIIDSIGSDVAATGEFKSGDKVFLVPRGCYCALQNHRGLGKGLFSLFQKNHHSLSYCPGCR